MSDRIIPEATKLAAKRAFVRTTAQAYAATIPAGGVSAAALASVIENPSAIQIGTAAAAFLVSPLLAGAAAYLAFVSKGIPEEYAAAEG